MTDEEKAKARRDALDRMAREADDMGVYDITYMPDVGVVLPNGDVVESLKGGDTLAKKWKTIKHKFTADEHAAIKKEAHAEPTLREAVASLRAIPGEWKNLEDPLEELRKIRYGEDSTSETTSGLSPDSSPPTKS